MYKIIAAIIGGIFLVVATWIGKSEEPSQDKTQPPIKQPSTTIIESNIVNYGDNNTITSVETQIN